MKLNKKIILVFSLMLIISIVGCGESQKPITSDNNIEEGSLVNDAGNNQLGVIKDNFVIMTEEGYEPKILAINAGETVLFRNEGAEKNWPASDIHPTHQLYPGSDIKKCKTDEKADIFDACRGLENGEGYSFVFKEKGTWDYHNHLRPSMAGTIIVE